MCFSLLHNNIYLTQMFGVFSITGVESRMKGKYFLSRLLAGSEAPFRNNWEQMFAAKARNSRLNSANGTFGFKWDLNDATPRCSAELLVPLAAVLHHRQQLIRYLHKSFQRAAAALNTSMLRISLRRDAHWQEWPALKRRRKPDLDQNWQEIMLHIWFYTSSPPTTTNLKHEAAFNGQFHMLNTLIPRF